MTMPTFSSRFPRSLSPTPLMAAYHERVSSGRPLLDLTLSNPTRALLPEPTSILSHLSRPGSVHYAPDPRGLLSAREAISRYYQEVHHLSVAPDRLVLTASTSEAYSFLFKLLADAGDALLIPAPSYPLFAHLASLEGLTTVSYPFREGDGWMLDESALEQDMPEHAKALVVVNPNNPTGAYVTEPDARRLIELCDRHQMALISDEVFSDFPLSLPEDACPVLARHSEVLTFSLGGLSKLLGLPQLKLAWILVNGPDAAVRDALAGLEFIADTYLSVGTPIQLALPDLLLERELLASPLKKRLRQGRDVVLSCVGPDSLLTALPVEGGWYQVLRFPRVLSEDALATQLLLEDGVFVHPGYFFDFDREGYLVISLLTPPDALDVGLRAIERQLQQACALSGREP